jgi:Flp pilus assembly protein TadG
MHDSYVTSKASSPIRSSQRGVTLLLVCILMFAMIAMAALAIDVAWLYTARSEAQRAADAAALAGAKEFLDSGFTSGLITSAQVAPLSRQKAQAVATTNTVAGVAASVADGDITFDFSRTGDPLITVTVQRSSAAGNPIPTFFARLFGRTAVDVRATATAEAFNPSGTGVPVTASCAKPWILPNCDQNALHTTPQNPNCPGSAMFIKSDGSIAYPGDVSSGGIIGQQLTLKSGDPHNASAPSQYYPIDLTGGSLLCPSCSQGGGGVGGAQYRLNIECCNTVGITCGASVSVNTQTGNLQGPTQQGVKCLIHEQNSGVGQDTILIQDPPPFPMTGGTNNPDPSLQGQRITSSASIVTIPVYDGVQLCPGASCPSNITVPIVGFLQVFLTDVSTGGGNAGDVHAYILNVAGCGANGGGGGGAGGPVGGGGASPVPIRLVHT